MKRFSLLLLVFALFSCKNESKETISSKKLEVSDNEIVNYVEYCNDRFKICFDYPSNFGAQPEPVNGDGRSFLNEIDSSQIVLYGFLDQGNEGILAQRDILEEVMEIENFSAFKNGFEVEGTENESGFMHLERVMIKADSTAGTYQNGEPINIIYSLQFTFPESKSDKYLKYWDKITEKLD